MKLLSCDRLFATPWTVAYRAPPSMEFPGKSSWSQSPFPSPGHLPNPGIKPWSPTLQADALQFAPPGRPAVIQVYAPTTNGEENEVKWFYEDL